MKPIHIGFVLVLMMLLCTIGIATANGDPPSVTQTVSGSVPTYTITITGPIDISGWTLERGVNNEKDVGPVIISTTAPSDYTLVLTVAGDHDRLWSASLPALENPMKISAYCPPVPEETGWQLLTTGALTVLSRPATPTPTAIPIRLRQMVTTNDATGDYSVQLTYALSVVAPSTT